jgi:hypothetical protein
MADGPSYYLEDFAGSEFARYTFQGKLMGEPLKIRLLELEVVPVVVEVEVAVPRSRPAGW